MRVMGLLLDLDGVFYVGDEVAAGAHEALSALRDLVSPGVSLPRSISQF